MELTSNAVAIDQYFISRKLLRNINLFWTGFLIYTLSFTLLQTTYVNANLCAVGQLFGLLFLIPTLFNIIKFKFDNLYLHILFLFFCCWIVTIIIRGFNLNTDFIKQMLFDADFGILPYFVPLILLFPKKVSFYKKVFDIIIILDIAYILFDLVFFKILLNPDQTDLTSQGVVEQFTKTLAVPNALILLTFLYHTNKRKLIAIAVALIFLFLGIYKARRGLVFISASTIFFSLLLNMAYSKRKLIIVLGALVFAIVIFFKVKENYQSEGSIFNSFAERLDEDTRTKVEDAFYADLTTKDWIIGKGINGQYYCPYIDEFISGYRPWIETDYLQLILKGGIISLGLILLIMVPAVIKGLFFSKNMLTKAAAIWILLWIIYLYPTSVTTFTLHYILVWISVGLCYSKKIRNIPEKVMRSYFQEKYSISK